MNSSVRLALAAAIAVSSTLIATVAQVHAQSVQDVQIKPPATEINPALRYKIDVLRPSPGGIQVDTSDRFRLFDQFRDNKPGWIEVKKADPADHRVLPAIPSAVQTLQNLNR
ncbi:MAG: hypothetical protein KME10_29350 [Plectolyngbya sp. WJT66-NPBG17]|nr:hypothetical protein [Plectolyngbya sp. WJT66-NPBG17]